MKKDKLYTERFSVDQEVVLKFAKVFKDGVWKSYSKEEKWIVDSVSPKSVNIHLEGSKKQRFTLTHETIRCGLVRIIK